MKKLMMLTLACAAAAVGANAWELTLTTNAAPTMIVPPAVDYSQSYNQIKQRAETNEVIAMGALRRVGPMVLIAANAGNTTNDTVTTTNYVAAGVWYTDHDAIPADAATIITNVSTVIAPIDVPLSGTVQDYTVTWFRVPVSRKSVVLQPTIPYGSVEYTDVSGNKLTETNANSLVKLELAGFTGALYGRATTNDCTVSVLPW